MNVNTSDAFYAAGHDYTVVLTGAVIDGQTVNTALAAFSIEHRSPTPEQSADGLLDRADGIETNKTLRQAMRIVAAVLAGKVSGAGSGTETFKGLDGSTVRVTVTTDPAGNRTNVTTAKGVLSCQSTESVSELKLKTYETHSPRKRLPRGCFAASPSSGRR